MTKFSTVLATVLVFVFGCKNTATDKKLDDILAKLDTIEKKIGQGGGGGGQQPQGPPMPKPGVAYQLPVEPTDAYRGGKNAKVTIVEAFEFACPYCAMVSPTLDALAEQYKPDDLKIVQKHFIVHPDLATNAAYATCAAHLQGKFAEYEKKLWHSVWGKDLTNIQGQNREGLGADQLKKLAKEVGLDMAKYDADIKEACPAHVKKNIQQLATLGVAGTPSIFINGISYEGSRSVDGFKAVIDAEIAKADEAIKNGVSLENYYSELMKKAKPKIE